MRVGKAWLSAAAARAAGGEPRPSSGLPHRPRAGPHAWHRLPPTGVAWPGHAGFGSSLAVPGHSCEFL